jgi:hypothetical protein
MTKKENNVKDNTPDPYDRLRVYYARGMLGHVDIPPELIEEAKKYSGDKAAALWEELEAMGDIGVRELIYEGRHGKKDIFSFKISTPLHTYLDTGSKEDIIELVKNDIKTATSAFCPACKQKVNYEDRDGPGNMISPCGSLMGSIPANFASFSTQFVQEKYGFQGIYSVLSNWENLYHHDHDTEYDWLLLEKMKLKKIPSVAMTLAKPSMSPRISTKRIPVFGSWEEDDDINSLYNKFIKNEAEDMYFSAPKCTHCKYCLEVYDCGRFSDHSHFCVYPVEKKDYNIGIELSFEIETLKGYREDHEGIIKNAFMWELLSDMKGVDCQTRDLEGKLSPPFNKFDGPICLEFDIDLKHMDLEDNGGPFRIMGEVDIVFGHPNLEEIENEIIRNERKVKIKNLNDKAHALMDSDPNVEKMNMVKIEMNDIHSNQAHSLIRYLASNFTLDELHLAITECKLPINTSNKAYGKVIEKSIKLREQDSGALN